MIALILAATLSIEEYATMPQLSSPRFSPDGKRVVYVLTRADLERTISAYDSDVWLINVDGSADRRITSSPMSDSSPKWSPDGESIAFLSDRNARTQLWLIDPDGGEARQVTNEPMPVREYAWSPDGKSIAFTRLDEPPKDDTGPRVVGEGMRHMHLYVLDLASGKVRALTSGAFTVFTFDWSPDGKTIVFARGPHGGLDGLYLSDIWTVTVANGAMRALVERPGIDRLPVYAPDGKSIAFASAGGVRDWLVEQNVHVVSASGGTPQIAAKDFDRSVESIRWDDDGIRIEAPIGLTTQVFKLGAPRPSAEGLATDPDVHGGKTVFVYQNLTMPPEVWIDGKQLTHHNDVYRTRTLGTTRVIRWKNPKDNLEIEGLLTLPVGYKPGTRVPLLTFVHGGPASRFDHGFLGYLGHIYAPHALSAAGFAVFRPNPRGTGGYGLAFRAANVKDWATMPWLDIESGIDKLVADGIADPKRLGLMGWSYGGYMAAWALGHSDRFKAVSVGAPVVDFMSFHGTTDIRDFIPFYYPGFDLDRLRAQSPLWNLRKTKAKVLIQHGDADDRVPLSQGTMLYRRLDELGADVTMVVYPRTAHIPREPRLRIDVARRNLELFTGALLP